MKSSYENARKAINSISDTFCAAKWYNVSIWLGNGRTASCHHPLAHKIPDEELAVDPSALHNTLHKKKQRKMMLEGERPPECSYCWTAEDASGGNREGVYSDRIYQSARYSEEEIEELKKLSWDKNVDPKTLEICFDNLCNLACSYCNSEFSSTWAKDISDNGPYKDMITGGGHTYKHDGAMAMPFGNKNEGNIYVKRFFDWFPKIKNGLDEFRVSGGEPSRSPSFWKLLDICDNESFDFAVNSNLIMDDKRLDKLIAASSKFKKFDIYTSAECMGKNQEFVRDGFEWDIWTKNMFKLQNSNFNGKVNIMMTISALSIWTVAEFLEMIVEWRRKINQKEQFYMSVNILRFPSFQSVNIIDQSIKEELANKIETILNKSREIMIGWEANQFERLIKYLRNVERSYEDQDKLEDKRKDFINFINQYADRRKKPLETYLPQQANLWLKNLTTQENV